VGSIERTYTLELICGLGVVECSDKEYRMMNELADRLCEKYGNVHIPCKAHLIPEYGAYLDYCRPYPTVFYLRSNGSSYNISEEEYESAMDIFQKFSESFMKDLCEGMEEIFSEDEMIFS